MRGQKPRGAPSLKAWRFEFNGQDEALDKLLADQTVPRAHGPDQKECGARCCGSDWISTLITFLTERPSASAITGLLSGSITSKRTFALLAPMHPASGADGTPPLRSAPEHLNQSARSGHARNSYRPSNPPASPTSAPSQTSSCSLGAACRPHVDAQLCRLRARAQQRHLVDRQLPREFRLRRCFARICQRVDHLFHSASANRSCPDRSLVYCSSSKTRPCHGSSRRRAPPNLGSRAGSAEHEPVAPQRHDHVRLRLDRHRLPYRGH